VVPGPYAYTSPAPKWQGVGVWAEFVPEIVYETFHNSQKKINKNSELAEK